MAIKLNSISQIPQSIACALRRLDCVFVESEFIENVLGNSDLYQIAGELDRLCVEQGVVGYHFTRAIQEEIEVRGLQAGTGADRRREFLLQYGYRFSEAQREWIHYAWEDYFAASQTQTRDGRIWFNFTLAALDNGGADDLLTYFGGEVINMPLTQDEEIAAVLRTIGQPLIIECALAAERLHTFSEIPWGKTWLSSYHVTLNYTAQQFDVDAYLEESVSPSQIVSIRPASRRGSAWFSAT